MKITLKLYATLRDYLPPETPGGKVIIDLPEGATIPDALATHDVPLGLAHIIMINGRHVLRPEVATRRLKEGEDLAVFPAIGGG